MGRPARSTNSVSLFPFLAVLVCAMGALIFLLLVTTHRIRKHARAEAAQIAVPIETPEELVEPEPLVVVVPIEPAPEPKEPLPAPLPPWQPPAKVVIDQSDKVRARIAALAAEREARRKQIAARQAALESNQENLAESQSHLQQAAAQLSALQKEEAKHRNAYSEMEVKQAALERQLTELERKLAETRNYKARASTKYSIIPYDGVSGTTRRPILIDCSDRGLRFIPEDVLLQSEDLDGFTARRNPVLAGTEALVDYWKAARRQRLGEPPEPEPYVLLIVRPSGSLAYYAARKLLAALDEPMGYELVAEDWELDLPDPDPAATTACRNAVERLIKERQRMMSILRNGPERDASGRIIHFDNRTGLVDVKEAEGDAESGDRWGFGNADAGNALRGRSSRQQSAPSSGVTGGDPSTHPGTGQPDTHGSGLSAVPSLSKPGAGREAGVEETGMGSPNPTDSGAPDRLPAFPGSGADGRPMQPRARQQPTAQQQTASSQPLGRQPHGLQPPSAEQRRVEQPVARFGTPLSDQFGSPASQPPQSRGNDYGQSGTWDSGGARGSGSGKDVGNSVGSSATGDSMQRGGASPGQQSSSAEPTQAKMYEFGGTRERSLDEQVPQDRFPSLGPTQTLRGSANSRAFHQRRWGLYGPKASIGFERQMTLRVEADRVTLNEDRTIPVSADQPTSELVSQVLGVIDEEVRGWGWPPQNFYWVPSIRFVVLPGGSRNYDRLHDRLRSEGLSTTVELRLKRGNTPTQRK